MQGVWELWLEWSVKRGVAGSHRGLVRTYESVRLDSNFNDTATSLHAYLSDPKWSIRLDVRTFSNMTEKREKSIERDFSET